MKSRQWSLAIVLVLVNYIIFATLFTRLVETDFNSDYTPSTPVPTFTPAPAQPLAVVPTPEPVTPPPSPTPTRVVDGAESGAQGASQSPPPTQPPPIEAKLVAPGPVNIRAGPGTNYQVLGTLNPDTTMPIVGRNADATWWQIKISDGTVGWVADSVVTASKTQDVPEVGAPPPLSSIPSSVPAQPAASMGPAISPRAEYQYQPAGWWAKGENGGTRFWGTIKDASGRPVDGTFVQARCGNYTVISNPSGPVGWGPNNQSDDWPPGYYELTVDAKPIPCVWLLTIVDTTDRQQDDALLSELAPVEVTLNNSVIEANWRKNW